MAAVLAGRLGRGRRGALQVARRSTRGQRFRGAVRLHAKPSPSSFSAATDQQHGLPSTTILDRLSS